MVREISSSEGREPTGWDVVDPDGRLTGQDRTLLSADVDPSRFDANMMEAYRQAGRKFRRLFDPDFRNSNW